MRPSASIGFDHGAAIRVPAAQDAKGWRSLMSWLGEHGQMSGRPGVVSVTTPFGSISAAPGDWIVLSYRGAFHVAGARWRDEG